MKNKKMRLSYRICWIILIFSTVVFGQKPNTKEQEPVLVPLTAEEAKIDVKSLVANQPDYMATENFFFSEGFGGFSASQKVAKKGNQYRIDTGVVVAISELNKPTINVNNNKTYEESVGLHKPFVTPSKSLNPTDLLGFEDITFSALGTITLDRNKLLKIQAGSKHFEEKVFLYADLGRKNLITIVQVLGLRQGSIERLVDISFDVPVGLFNISGYRVLPKFEWTRVKSAKVIFKGTLAKDAVVFRHEQYIFVHPAEFEDFLVDLKNGIGATVVFEGLLQDKDGSYIWRSNADEAISGEFDYELKPGREYLVKIHTGQNSFSISDPKNRTKALVEVSW